MDKCNDRASNKCSHYCKNVHGSHICQCRNGYRLNENGFSCDGMLFNSRKALMIISFLTIEKIKKSRGRISLDSSISIRTQYKTILIYFRY